MKKLIFAILVFALILTLASCGAPAPATPSESPGVPQEEHASPADPKLDYPPTVSLTVADVTVVGTEIIDKDKEPTLKVHYDITNKSTGILNLLGTYEIDDHAFQNGEKLTNFTGARDKSPEMQNIDRHIAPGVTARVAKAYKLKDMESEVTLIIPDGKSKDVPDSAIKLDLKNLLPPLPWPEAGVNPPLETEGYIGTEGMIEGSPSAFYIKLLGHEFFENEGDKYIRLRYEFKNEGEKELRAYGLYNYTFQDGVQLGTNDWGNEDMKETDEEKAISTYAQTGEMVVFAHVFKLRSDSPILARMGGVWWKRDATEEPKFIGELIPVE